MRQPRPAPSFASKFLRAFFSDIFRDFVTKAPDLDESKRKLDEKINNKLASNDITNLTKPETLESKRVFLDALNHEKARENPQHIKHLSQLLQSDHSIDHYMISSSTNFLNDFFSTKSDALDKQYPTQEQQTKRGELVNKLKNQNMKFGEIYSWLKDVSEENAISEQSHRHLYSLQTNQQDTDIIIKENNSYNNKFEINKINETIKILNQKNTGYNFYIADEQPSMSTGNNTSHIKIPILDTLNLEQKKVLSTALKHIQRITDKVPDKTQEEIKKLSHLLKLIQSPQSMEHHMISSTTNFIEDFKTQSADSFETKFEIINKETNRIKLIKEIKSHCPQLTEYKLYSYLAKASEEDCIKMKTKIEDKKNEKDFKTIMMNGMIIAGLDSFKGEEKKASSFSFAGLFSKKGPEPSPINRFIDTFEKFGKEKPKNSIIPLSSLQLHSNGKVNPGNESR